MSRSTMVIFVERFSIAHQLEEVLDFPLLRNYLPGGTVRIFEILANFRYGPGKHHYFI